MCWYTRTFTWLNTKLQRSKFLLCRSFVVLVKVLQVIVLIGKFSLLRSKVVSTEEDWLHFYTTVLRIWGMVCDYLQKCVNSHTLHQNRTYTQKWYMMIVDVIGTYCISARKLVVSFLISSRGYYIDSPESQCKLVSFHGSIDLLHRFVMMRYIR